MSFTPVATTDTLETFRTRYNATNITVVDDSSTSVDITLATDSLKLSGGTGIASAISGDTVTFNLSNSSVSAATYGSSTAIPVIAVNAQGQITSASTASISTDLTLVDDASSSATISLATDTLKISGGTGTTSAVSGDTLTINLDNTAVSAASYGSASAIPVITVDAQGRITAASTASVSSDLTIADTSSTTEVITLGSETLKFDGGTGISASISSGTVTYNFDGTSFTTFVFTATSGQTTFSGNDDNTNTLAYSAGKRNVFLNGVLLDESDFTASNGTSVVLGSGAAASDILTVIAFAVNNIAVLDANGSEFVLDADGDTSITADTDDQIDVKIGGADDFAFKANSFEVQTGSIIDMNGTELVLDADADTSITADTDDQVDIKIGGTDRFSIASTGKVTSTSTGGASNFDIINTADGTLGPDLTLYHNSASPADNDIVSLISFAGNDDGDNKTTYAQIRGTATDVSDTAEDGKISFFLNSAGTLTERVTIDNGGRLLINCTNFSNEMLQIDGGTQTALRLDNDGTSLFSLVNFSNANGIVGTIKTTGSSTQYNTSSDYRLKENVEYTWDATTRLKQLKPARFNFIADESNTLVDGFIAHEVSDIVPEAISGTKDATKTQNVYNDEGVVTGTETVPDYQGIDQSKLVPLLVKTIQELEARITTLEG